MTLLSNAPAPLPEAPGSAFCESVGIADDLDHRLSLDRNGRPFQPAMLTMSTSQREITAQFELLLRPEPVGGAEALIDPNRTRLIDTALTFLHHRLAGGSESERAGILLADLARHLGALRTQFTQRGSTLDQEYRACHDALRAWQSQTNRKSGLLQNMAGWLFGSNGQISLPQAIGLWNERERLTLHRQATRAAGAVIGRLADEVSSLLDRQAGLVQSAERALSVAQEQLAQKAAVQDAYAPWNWHADPAAIATALTERIATERLLTTLLAELSAATDSAGLAASVQRIAAGEAERLIADLSLAEAIELEASTLPLPEGDPLVVVGRHLLSDIEQRQTWRLRRGARPRTELIQITNDGEPLFDLDGLGSAAYGDNIDRIGFVRLDLGIASDDLQVLHEGQDAFVEVLAQRNLYVIEELAGKAVSATPTHADPTPPASPNGQTAHTVWEER
jgi:hypothetical protein